MRKKNAPPWLRWVYLAMAVFFPFASWMDFRQYQHYQSLSLFSAEEWEEILNSLHFHWAIQALLTACLLYLFFTLTRNQNRVLGHSLGDSVFSTVLLLFWACLPLLISVQGNAQVLWGITLAALVVIAGYGWIKCMKNKRLEETEHE